jgi:hypothetical protein
MTMTRLLIVVSLVIGSACASAMWMTPSPTLDEYPAARVRIYYSGRNCRLEVITATHTVATLTTRCVNVPHRVQP